VYLLNRTTNRRLQGKTPYELWHNVKVDISHLKIFGSEWFKHIPSHQRRKFDPKGVKRIFLGYEDNKSLRLLNPKTGKIDTSCSVTFNESVGRFHGINKFS
jgi:hypothetical protein